MIIARLRFLSSNAVFAGLALLTLGLLISFAGDSSSQPLLVKNRPATPSLLDDLRSDGPLQLPAGEPTDIGTIPSGFPVGSQTAIVPKQIYRTNSGPWGELEYYVAYLHAPEVLLDAAPAPSATPVWHFTGQDLETSIDDLRSIGFTGEDLSWTAEPSRVHVEPSGARFFPPAAFIEGISPERRSALRKVLERFEENPYYERPIVIESGDPVTWYREAGLSEELVQVIAPLCYPAAGGVLFSDVACVLSKITSTEEEKKFLRALTRTRTLVLRLVVGEESNIEELTEYWAAGYKRKDISSILEAIVETPGVERLDIAHLLPPTPRRLLYTYPDMSATLTGRLPDCHWTSTNFFNAPSKDRFLDTDAALREISENYDAADLPLKFGDLLGFFKEGTQLVFHTAIHIADDIVFTKNDYSPSSPWVLMRYSDMVKRYGMISSYQVRAYRKK